MGRFSRHWWVRVAGWLVLLGLWGAAGSSAQAAETQRIAVLALQGKKLSNDVLNLITDEVRAGVLDATKGQRFVVMSRENMSIILKDMGKDLSCIQGECEVETGRNIGAAYVVSGSVLQMDRSWVCTLKIHEVNTGALVAADKAVAPKALELSDGVRVLAADLMRQSLGEDATAADQAKADDGAAARTRDAAEKAEASRKAAEARRAEAERLKAEKAEAKARARTAKAEAKAKAKAQRQREYEARRAAALEAEGQGTVVVDNGWWASVATGAVKVSGAYEDATSVGLTSRIDVGRSVGGVVVGVMLSSAFSDVLDYESQAASGCAQQGNCLAGDFSLIRSGAFAFKGIDVGGVRLDAFGQAGLALLSTPMSQDCFETDVVNDTWGGRSSEIGLSNQLPFVGGGVAVRKAVYDGRPTADFRVVADYVNGFGVLTDVTVGLGAAF